MRNSSTGRRVAARVATIGIGVALPIIGAATPALALKRDDGSYPGPSLGTGLTLLYFVVIPVGAFLVISALSILPSALRRPRYRPGKTWEHGSRWFGAPAEGATADNVTAAGSPKGGASAEW